MRRLLHVPIIHEEADLGSSAPALAQQSVALVGQRRWDLHRETVGRFWDSVAASLRSFDARLLRIYQDSLPVGGATGRRIVEEAARRGSRNYQLVLELLDKGAELRRTEDAALLLREHEGIRRSLEQRATGGEPASAEQLRRERGRLMDERDRFIAQAVDATLREDEVGVLFLGAFHRAVGLLPDDIAVEAVKDPVRVADYFEELARGHDDERFETLARYLAAPVDLS